MQAFSDQEISDGLFQIGPLKAPGPDGFPACFFRGAGMFSVMMWLRQ